MKFLEFFFKKCKYCGKPVDLFNNYHPECEKARAEGAIEIGNTVLSFILGSDDNYENLKTDVYKIAEKYNLHGTHFDTSMYLMYDLIVDTIIKNDKWSEHISSRMNRFWSFFNLNVLEMVQLGKFEKQNKADNILKLESGKIPENEELFAYSKFLFNKNEKPIDLIFEVDFFEQVTNVQYVGGHAGLGIRVAKGLYFRTGAFKGNPVKTEGLEFVDNGELAVTTKNIYFRSTAKSIRIPLNKIISMDPFSDGLGIHSDGVKAKPIVFRKVDGWYLFNMISLVNQM